jgi:hypothetical protein
VQLTIHKERIPPTRGLITAHTANGRPFKLADLQRWLRLNAFGYHVAKVDVLDNVGLVPLIQELLADAQSQERRLSLRTDCTNPPERLDTLAGAGLLDVFLCPPRWNTEHFNQWLDASREAGLPARVQIHAPLKAEVDMAAVADRLAEARVVAVNVALFDPFLPLQPCFDRAQGETTLDIMRAFVPLLEDRGIEANLLHVPFCLVAEDRWANVVNVPQFYCDHQQYERHSYGLAIRLFQHGPVWAGKAITMLLGRHTSFRDPLDSKLLPWILEHPWLRARLWAWHKLTRHKRLLRAVPKVVEPGGETWERARERQEAEHRAATGTECARCGLRRVCDQVTREFTRMLPDIGVRAQAVDHIAWPLHFSVNQGKHYDVVDAARLERPVVSRALAEQARAVVCRPPSREISSLTYEVQDEWCSQTEAAVRWYSHTNTEKLSTPLAKLSPPFTLSATFGGGIAEYIGFCVGRDQRVMCPMVGYSHELVLHAAEDGAYVLLRDGLPLNPTEFIGAHSVPGRIGSTVELRIVIRNIDGAIATQGVAVWEGATETTTKRSGMKYSVVIVCTRYARRLQAALLAIAHQQSFDLGMLEVIIAHVPGLDAAEDVIETTQCAYPNLHIIRAPFAGNQQASKGLMINECVRLASGEWITLLDADILVPPNMFSTIEAVEKDCTFIVPDGRKMLTKETTARILVGELEPWHCWQEVMDDPGELRVREAMDVPIGFCQCVRASCFDQLGYVEFNHFEAADSRFAQDVREQFGPERRLEGLHVGHLDHGGSHWYGTEKHL